MSRLETLRITRDRADQRRGRAGRLGPGICMRLWDEITDRQLNAESQPEIMDADLTPTVLQCAEWGSSNPGDLPWMTPPPTAAWQRAVSLLLSLDALRCEADGTRRITPRGRAMARIPVHPRLAHMILEASEYGAAERAAFIAAVISERSSHAKLRQFTDLSELVTFIERNPGSFQARAISRLAHQWCRTFKCDDEGRNIDDGSLLAWAFPDRIARKRDNRGVYLLQSGQGALIDTVEPLANEEWLVVAELHDQGANTRIRLAAAIDKEQVHKLFTPHFESSETTRWDKRSEAVVSMSQVKLGAITIKESASKDPDPELIATALMDGVRARGVDQLPWSKKSQSLRERVTLLSRTLPEQGWPDMSDTALSETLDEWLKPACAGLSRWSHLQKLDMYQVVNNHLMLKGCSTRLLDKLAPTHIEVPSGSRIQVCYDAEQPYLRVRIQEVFGLMQTPKIAEGRVPVVMHLLSPAQRPVQVTQDLAGFWSSSYALVRKDMRGRYPRHYWPEDPSQAEPTRRVRPR
jgi:ATP-dependent helicase HrpB